ncbi:telomere repeats-binding bouquet formation protein 1 isoform X2 [Scyliorhinus canicula]|uniref:telomere repeats-binding bouquet formation protein 1 isoform X2 n=1 Tax=Scyliorhinus canicula TaxID=7830 RepID=UPI0018F29A07|nr:telomere repeats-binding bouquet formation protein 1 isoform X2 [Scyliorhinus canicula]
MENPEKTGGNMLCGLKTDLNLLLECLKYQMDSPVTQKQALITIHSICQQNSEASDYFREIGGLQFVNGLVKLSDVPILREAALFTLTALAESSVYCQQSLCTAELLSDVALSLAQKDASLILKKLNVYVILVLVIHNKIGQALVRTTGCIDVLLNLFRTSFPMSDQQSMHENIGQCYELWSSIGSTLCACANNPQNEENQRLCTAAFPFAKDCLQKCIRQEIIRPICAFIGLAVANNSYVQDYFCKVGGLDALAQALVRLVDESINHHSNTYLAIAVIKTLDACISENSPAASCLSEYFIVPKLLALLMQNGLDISSKLGIILAIGHCTDGCEAHQYQLLQSNGISLMIQIVAETQDEDQRKAATFVLQSCQLVTEKLSNGLAEDLQPREDTFTSSGLRNEKDNSLNNYWKFAEAFLNRIKALEKQQEEMTSHIMNTGVADVHQTATGPNSHVNLKLQTCEPLLTGTDQMVKQKEDVPLKHCSEQHSLDKSCMDNTITDTWTGGTRQAEKQDLTPEKRKFHLNHVANEYRVEGSVIATINPSCSRAGENKMQYRDQRLMEKVRRQIFVEDDFPQETSRKNANVHQFGGVDKLSSEAKARDMKSQQCDLPIAPADGGGPSAFSDIQNMDRFPETDQQKGAKVGFVQCGNSCNQPVTVPEAELPRASTSRNGQKSNNEQDFKKSHDSFKRPAPMSRKRSQQNYIDPLILCSNLIDNEINLSNPASSFTAAQDFRCSGCSTISTSLNSRNFCKILQVCPNKCDRHKVIQECEDRYKKELKKSLTCYSTMHDKKILLTPIKRTASHMADFDKQQTDFLTWHKPPAKDVHTKKILLTPIQKPESHVTNFLRQQTDFRTWPKPLTKDVHAERCLLTPKKKSASGAFPKQRRGDTLPCEPAIGQGHEHLADCRKDLRTPRVCNQTRFRDHAYSFDDNKHSDICEYSSRINQKTRQRRRRKDFTEKEVNYLVNGVKKMGYHWNSILWSYPFQKGRTNVDLAQKYRNLQKRSSTKSS